MVLRKVVRALSLAGLRISELAVFLLVLITGYSVIGRYFFNSPSIHAVEISKYLMVVLVWAAVGWTYRIDRHVGFEMVKHLKSAFVQQVFRLISRSAVFVFSLSIFYSGILATFTSFDKNYRTASLLDFPLWVIMACIPAGVLLLGLEALHKTGCEQQEQEVNSVGTRD